MYGQQDYFSVNVVGLQTFDDYFIILFSGLGTFGSSCETLKQFATVTVNWPDITSIIRSMNSMYDALKEMLDFFDMIRDALKKVFCMVNPLEALAELEIVE